MADSTTTDKPKETKSEHFKRLASYRVNQVMEWCAKIEKLNAPNLYEYTDEQITAIEEALNKATSQAVTALRNRSGKRQGFSL